MISCILLAAGESRRFGSPKPIAKIGPKTVIETITARLIQTQLSEIVVVLGANSSEVSPFITKDIKIKVVVNEHYQNGQTSSFKTGLSYVNPKAKGVMLLPADMPFIKNTTIDRLIKVFLENSHLILIPAFGGRKAHPPIFPVSLKNELEGLKDNEPISNIIHKHEPEVLKFNVDDKGVVLSFNTPQELQNVLQGL